MDEKVENRQQAIPCFCKSAQGSFVDGEEDRKEAGRARGIM